MRYDRQTFFNLDQSEAAPRASHVKPINQHVEKHTARAAGILIGRVDFFNTTYIIFVVCDPSDWVA